MRLLREHRRELDALATALLESEMAEEEILVMTGVWRAPGSESDMPASSATAVNGARP